jgi:hypothetical protein
LEILIIWHLGRVVTRPEVLFLLDKTFITEIGSFQGDVQKCLHGCLFINCYFLTPSIIIPISTSSAVRAPENTEDSTVDAKPANEGDVQMLYISE